MAIAQRTATSGTAAGSAAFTPTVPTDAVYGDILIIAVANAGTTGPTPPSGLNLIGSWTAGAGQNLAAYWVVNHSSTSLAFTNSSTAAAWAVNAYSGCDTFNPCLAAHNVAFNTTSNTTLPTGAPVTHDIMDGSYEVLLYAFTSNGTISAVASGSTIDVTQANSTTISVVLGHNNTTSIAHSTTCTAFSQTLSGANAVKTGVGIPLNVPHTFASGHENELTDPYGFGPAMSKTVSYDGTFPASLTTGMATVAANTTPGSRDSHE